MEVFTYIIILLASALFFGNIAKRFKQPSIVGEIIGGIIVGPFLAYVLSNFLPDGHYIRTFLSVVYASPKTENLISFSGVMLMFGAGLETSIKDLIKEGKSALLTAIFGVLISFFLGYYVGVTFLGLSHIASMYIGVAVSITAVALSVTALIQMNKLNTKEGLTIVGAAVADDVLGIILLSILMSIKSGGSFHIISILITTLIAITFVGFSILIAPKICKFLFNKAAKLKAQDRLALILLWIFTFSLTAHFLQIHLIIGAYLGGLSIQSILREGEKDILENWIWGFFAPLFFAWTGFSVVFSKEAFGISLLFILGAAFIGKVAGGGLGALISGFSLKSSIEVGIGMNGRAAVELIVANVALESGLIDRSIYSTVVFMAITMALITPILLKWYINRFMV